MPRVVLVAFEGAQTLDLTGPAEVFAAANRQLGRAHYQVVVAAVGGGERRTSCGLQVVTRRLGRLRVRRDDVVLVVGGDEAAVRGAAVDRALRRWLLEAGARARWVASVCTGAFVLAAAGLLDGKRAATHWAACERLARTFPAVTVDANAIFVRDGDVWTSAGVTTGIDMTLAMVEDELGAKVADAVAARLVLSARRPGFQSQFSAALVAQVERGDPLGRTIAWARANLAEADVDTFARRAGVSLRTLHRKCREQLRLTPAKLLDRLRVEHARTLLATGALPAKTVAARCGFGNTARMRRAFERELGMGPRDYRVVHAPAREVAPPRRARRRQPRDQG